MSDQSVKKAIGRLCFVKMLLSLCDNPVETDINTTVKGKGRDLEFSLKMNINEEYYQLCLDTALDRLLNGG